VPSERPSAGGITTASHADPLDWIDEELVDLERQGLLRNRSTHTGAQQVRLQVGSRELINFGSNDYLGLAADARLSEAAAKVLAGEGSGSGASPLVTGHGTAHERLEAELARFEGTERALLFSSGYAANLGAITALATRGDAIYADAKNHASMIDGCRLSRADVHVYPHGNAAALAAQLSTTASGYRRRMIATESVFSMDGDLAPLVELAELAERFDCMLLVDEAHATGVFGASGRGLGEQLGIDDRLHVRIGTLSKALGAAGGFVCGSERLIEWLVNRARPYVFSTALPPANCAAASAALAIIEQNGAARKQLLVCAQSLREQLTAQGWRLGASASQIIPLIVGDPERATELSRKLRDAGLLVPAIRPPSVPAGESLLRISLTTAHTPAMLETLLSELRLAAGTREVRL
jgi:8-amino-7-oxononanoate synthase